MDLSPSPSETAVRRALEDGISLIGIELRVSPNPLRKALGILLEHSAPAVFDLINRTMVTTFGEVRAQEIFREIAEGKIRGQEVGDEDLGHQSKRPQ